MKTLGAIFGLFVCTAVMAAANTAYAAGPANQRLPLYRPMDQLSGEITLTGSNTMSQLANGWIDTFRKFYPDVKFNVNITGSRSAIPALIEGTTTFGLLSRSIRKDEIDAFQAKFGYPPTRLIPSYERMAIYVHKDCPIQELTLAQVYSIFAQDGKARTWGDVGVSGRWANRTIAIQGRGPTTGSTVFLQTSILRGEDFDDKMVVHRSNFDLVGSIGQNPDAIGYAGLMFQNPDIKAVPLATRSGLPAIAVDGIQADQGLYPLMRPLQIVVNQRPGQQLRPEQREFIKYVFSRLGQEEVVKGGFQPIPGNNARFALGQVGLQELN